MFTDCWASSLRTATFGFGEPFGESESMQKFNERAIFTHGRSVCVEHGVARTIARDARTATHERQLGVARGHRRQRRNARQLALGHVGVLGAQQIERALAGERAALRGASVRQFGIGRARRSASVRGTPIVTLPSTERAHCLAAARSSPSISRACSARLAPDALSMCSRAAPCATPSERSAVLYA